MRRELVLRHRWLSERDFLEDWALSKLSLGINLIAMSALLAQRIAGTRGLVVSLGAMVVPASVITALMTAGYSAVQNEPIVRNAFAGAGPVTAGMTVGLSYVFAQQAVRRGARAILDWSYWVVVIALGLAVNATPTIMVFVGIAVGLALLRGESTRASADPGS